MNKIPVIFFLGKSGSGKDTQAQLLVERFHFIEISSGGILREFVKRTEEEGNSYEAAQIKYIIDSGKFVPTLTVACAWYGRLLDIMKQSRDVSHVLDGIVFSGSPRKINEAWLFEDFFGAWPDGKYFETKTVLIDISEEEMNRRLGGRRECEQCKKIFMAKDAETLRACDVCGGDLVARADDSQEGIDNRLGEYNAFVVPTISFYKEKNKLITINGEQPVEKVHKDITQTLGL